MTNKKMTKRTVVSAMISYLEGVDESVVMRNNATVGDITVGDGVRYLKHELDLLNKKSNNRKPTKTQVANEELKEIIIEVLGDSDVPMTISEMQAANETLAGYSNQKISALVRQLISVSIAINTKDEKNRTVFSLV